MDEICSLHDGYVIYKLEIIAELSIEIVINLLTSALN